MKLILALLLVPSAAIGAELHGPYLDAAFLHPASIPFSAGAVLNSQMLPVGGMTKAGVVWHKADRQNTLMPQYLLDLGFEPVGWAIDIGLGGNSGNFLLPVGITANLAPSVLGPVLKGLKGSGNPSAQAIGNLLSSKNGGVAFGPTWTGYPMVGGTVQPFNKWRFPPGWFLGAMYSWK